MSNKPISLKVGDALPKSIGMCADALKEVMEIRLLMDKDVKRIKAREVEIQEHIIDTLASSDDTGAMGLKYQAKITKTTAGSVTDWEQVYDWIVENDRFDILGKSLNRKAVKEMFEAGQRIPGVEKINVKKLSITKVGK